jgi:hypothetical protein
MEDKRMNEIEEIEATEVDETQDSSNAGALLAGVIEGRNRLGRRGFRGKLRKVNCGVLQGRVPLTGRFPFFLFIKFWRCTNA